MKLILTLLSVVVLSMAAQAQRDTVIVDSVYYVKYDVVHLADKSSKRGTILSFDTNSGLIVIKDDYGRTYSYLPNQYTSYERDVLYKVRKKNKKNKVHLPRKENEWEFTAGLSAKFSFIYYDFVPDSYYLNAPDDVGPYLLAATLGAGKYFTRRHYVGLNSEIGLLRSPNESYFNIGARYCFQYDANKRNIATYIPLEVKYHHYSGDIDYSIDDTVFNYSAGSGYSWQYPSTAPIDYRFNTIGFSIGHGFGFILSDKHSLNLELFVRKEYMISKRFVDATHGDPQGDFSFFTYGFSLLFNY